MKVLLAALIFIVAVCCEKVTFNNYHVVRLQIVNSTQQSLFDNLVKKHNLDVWSDNLHDVLLPPSLHNTFKDHNIKQDILIDDLQALIDEENRHYLKNQAGEFFDTYRKTSEVMAWVDTLKSTYPNLVTTSEIGKTVHGQSIVGVHIHSSKGPAEKPRIVFNGGQHAREWISVPTVNYFLDQLLKGYTNGTANIVKYVDNIDWTIIPILNVDGFDFTWTSNRMWRKNRRDNRNGCFGVDTNRNWPYMWNHGGTSNDPCSDQYLGPSAGSEPEIQAMTNYLKNTPRIKVYSDFHSYSQLFMSPWGYTTALPKDYTAMNKLMSEGAAAIKKVHGTTFQHGSIANIIYQASGSSADYAYSLGVVHSYGFELRDTGRYGFILPASEIRPSGEEMFACVEVMANTILAN